MRIVYDLQLSLDSVPMEEIEINPNSRDKMDSFFSAVRQIFLDKSTRERLFQLLEKYYKPDTRKDCGRPGMMLWRVVILAALKQTIHCDYDRLTTLANGLKNLRLILGPRWGSFAWITPELCRKCWPQLSIPNSRR